MSVGPVRHMFNGAAHHCCNYKSHGQAGSLVGSILHSKSWLDVQTLDLPAPTDKVLQLYTGWPWIYDYMTLGSHAHDGRSRLDEGT